MKKALSFLLSLVMLAACACPAAALAEEESSGWFSGLMDGAKNAAEKGLSGLMKLLGGLMGEKEPLPAEEEEEYAEEEARSDIAEFFDCTFWEGDGRTMAIAYQDGAFRITVQDGEIPLSYLCEAEEVAEGDVRTVMHFHPALAPVKIGVLPLSKKLGEQAEKVYADLCKYWNCEYDDRGNIGKRYRRQDEIGTPYCVTYDFDSETDGCVTVRDRDSMEQERVKIEDLISYFTEKLAY